jgi:hypothetical protein
MMSRQFLIGSMARDDAEIKARIEPWQKGQIDFEIALLNIVSDLHRERKDLREQIERMERGLPRWPGMQR